MSVIPAAGQSRSTPRRLAVILVLVFAGSSLLSLGTAFLVIRSSIDKRLHAQLLEDIQSYKLLEDQVDLEERVALEVATVPPQSRILIYEPDAGSRIANVPRFPKVQAFGIVRQAAIGLETDAIADSYMVIRDRAGQGTLTMAISREQVSELGEVFVTVVLVSLIPTLALASLIGVVVARTARNRVEAIRTTLDDLTAGRLQARVPAVDAANDDLSLISRAVNRMASAQSAAVAALRQVSDDIAHDLKTPIQRVSVLLERLDAMDGLTLDHHAMLERARDETGQIIRTFQSLLQIAQIEGGSAGSRFTAVDLEQVVAGVVDVFVPTADESGHDLSLSTMGAGPFAVKGDRNLLGQVTANLIENALRHTPPGSRIEVRLSTDARAVTLEVRDTGPGIPLSERTNVLQRLYRLDRSRSTEGNGLGLSLVAAICDLHGASLMLDDNAPGLVVVMHFDPA